MKYAYCWRSGVIEFGEAVPAGALEIGYGDAAFKARVELYARHGYEKDVLLVPGIPEAASDLDAEFALRLFVKLVGGRKLSKREVAASRRAQNRALNAAVRSAAKEQAA